MTPMVALTPEELADKLCRLEILEKQQKANSVQGWIKTLWPIAVAIITVVMLYQSLASRVSYLETARAANSAEIAVLQANQASMMADIASLKTGMTILAENTSWMRNHWPGGLDGSE
jgi:hypothetical protein